MSRHIDADELIEQPEGQIACRNKALLLDMLE